MSATTNKARIPQAAELKEIEEAVDAAHEQVERVGLNVGHIARGGEKFEFTGEQAWELMQFVKSLRISSKWLDDHVAEIEASIDDAWENRQNQGHGND